MDTTAKVEKQQLHESAMDKVQDLHHAVDELEALRTSIENKPASDIAERPRADSLTGFLGNLPSDLQAITERIESEISTIRSLIF